MKKVWVLLFCLLYSVAAQAQVGKISADGDISYTTNAKELKYQRSAAPTYEQLLPQDNRMEQMQRQQAAQEVLEDEIKTVDDAYNVENKKSSVRLANYGNQREARNLMVVRAVANYKMGDEKLASQFEKVEDNAEFERKMQQIMENLSNNRMRNAKNREAVRILDDAGNKLYNLLAN